MQLNTRQWVRLSIFNLLIVASLGTLMRYKIAFEFPYFDQKHLQHAHSHFAFIGWVAQLLFVLMYDVMQRERPLRSPGLARNLLRLNAFCSYAMLISFAIQGYGLFSISFSTLSVITSYFVAYSMFSEMKAMGPRSYTNWFTAALWFNVISSIGTFFLAYMMASHNFDNSLHLGGLYFYLHFQYNGFFTFACLGLLIAAAPNIFSNFKYSPGIFLILFLSCIPAYFLSTLWAKMPAWLYVLTVAAAMAQLVGWIWLLATCLKTKFTAEFRKFKWIFILVGLALSLKFTLQLGSTIPWVGKLAFGFRPVVIAYLHLILLAIVSVFLLLYARIRTFLSPLKGADQALVLFVVLVYLNELVLAIQGIAAFSYIAMPFVNEILFGVAVLMFSVLVWLFASQIGRQPAVRKVGMES